MQSRVDDVTAAVSLAAAHAGSSRRGAAVCNSDNDNRVAREHVHDNNNDNANNNDDSNDDANNDDSVPDELAEYGCSENGDGADRTHHLYRHVIRCYNSSSSNDTASPTRTTARSSSSSSSSNTSTRTTHSASTTQQQRRRRRVRHSNKRDDTAQATPQQQQRDDNNRQKDTSKSTRHASSRKTAVVSSSTPPQQQQQRRQHVQQQPPPPLLMAEMDAELLQIVRAYYEGRLQWYIDAQPPPLVLPTLQPARAHAPSRLQRWRRAPYAAYDDATHERRRHDNENADDDGDDDSDDSHDDDDDDDALLLLQPHASSCSGGSGDGRRGVEAVTRTAHNATTTAAAASPPRQQREQAERAQCAAPPPPPLRVLHGDHDEDNNNNNRGGVVTETPHAAHEGSGALLHRRLHGLAAVGNSNNNNNNNNNNVTTTTAAAAATTRFSLPSYSATSFVRAYVPDASLNLEPTIIVSGLAACVNMVVVYFLQKHVVDTHDHLGLFLIGSYLVFASYYMAYYFLEQLSGSFRRIASPDKKFYIIGNLLKAGVLVSITPFAAYHLARIIVYDAWEGNTLRNLGCIYTIPDFISIIVVKRMRWSTWLHHLCVVVFNYFSIMNDYGNENVCRCVVVYAAFSTFAYCVNVLLASRFLGVPPSTARVLSVVALVVYGLCCTINWGWQVYYVRRLLRHRPHAHWTVYAYIPLISLVVWDDVVLNRWLMHHARSHAFGAAAAAATTAARARAKHAQ